jgi:sulfate/thiosulfate transport system permease protein
VLLPLAGLAVRAARVEPLRLLAVMTDPRTVAAFEVSFGSAIAAALLNLPFGFLLAWILTRYNFPGRRLIDGLIDLPFALPTAVGGIALASLYVDDGWIGALLAPLGIHLAFNVGGIVVALVFVGLPFSVRSIQPVLAGLEIEAEEAALTLGARPFAIFRRVILPPLAPAVLTGLALSFARGVGEYGSIIFIAGNQPAISEIVPLLIVTKLEQFDYPGAALLGTAMLIASLLLLLAIKALQGWGGSRDRVHIHAH